MTCQNPHDNGRCETAGIELAVQCPHKCKPPQAFMDDRSLLHQEYKDVNRTYNDVAQALSHYSSLSPRTDVYSAQKKPLSIHSKAKLIGVLQLTRMAHRPSSCTFRALSQSHSEGHHTGFL
jgi:hypothetical protein